MSRISFYLTVVAATVLLSDTVLAQQTRGPGYGDHMWYGGWHGWFFGPVMMIVFIAVVVVVVVLLVRWLGGAGQGTAPTGTPHKPPLDLLKERYARGEIDEDEFVKRRRVLEE